MAGMLAMETPSRIWRRIEDIENRDMDMPSLPSVPVYGDSEGEDESLGRDALDVEELSNISVPMHSTPTASSNHASTMRAASSTSSASRFANSIARTSRSSMGRSRKSQPDSFDDISCIPSLPDVHPERGTGHYSEEESEEDFQRSKESVPEVYLPPEDPEEEDEEDGPNLSLTDALESVSRTSSPQRFIHEEATPKKNYDYSVSLRSEPKPSPFDKFRNVALRRPASRTRTPSLSRTTASPASSAANTTPRSTRSPRSHAGSPLPTTVPLPRSATASPVIVVSRPDDEESGNDSYLQEGDTHSMDITDVHISPVRMAEEPESEPEQHVQELSDDGSQREPTFSSEGGPTFRPDQSDARASPRRSPGRLASAFSSPAPSVSFTPTPAFPRPRAHFNLPSPDDDEPATPAHPQTHEDDTQGDEEPLTPHTRRRSFLLAVINSTTRPRLKFPTPTPAKNAPRRPRSQAPPHASRRAAARTPSRRPTSLRPPRDVRFRVRFGGAPWATPAARSSTPHDGASIISTASSHDLTTHHHRANASFDPVMGFGGPQGLHGVGRFNAGKLNTYLHGLNRRLQEENEAQAEELRRLKEQMRRTEEEHKEDRRTSVGAPGKRASLGGTALGDVAEDVAAEGWLEDKAELEEMVEAFKEEATRCASEKQEVEKALEEEKEERARDKERWKERMKEVEKGVAGIIGDLEARLLVAEKRANDAEETALERVKDADRRTAEAQEECDAAMERAEKAEQVLESGQELGGELREANERVGKVLADLRNANSQIKELEDAVMQSDARVDDLEKELKEERAFAENLEQELDTKAAEMETQLENFRKLEEDLRTTQAYVTELEQAAEGAVARMESLEDELASEKEEVQRLRTVEEQAMEQIESVNGARERAEELTRQLEEALEAAEKKMLDDEGEVAELKGKVVSLERERERERQRDLSSASSNPLAPGPTDAELEALEEELDHANREIARLTTLLNQSPARKAIEAAKDAKIDMLEKEREDLLERNKALRSTVNEITTPNKVYNVSGISPIHRQVLSMSIRAPRTPGGPLRDMSWLHNTSADGSVSPLLGEIARLQRELDRANESIDNKLDKLEDAGLGVVGLTKRLEDARAKIVALEEEIARLSRKEQRRVHRLERARCQKCLTKVDLRSIIRAEGDESSMDAFNSSLPSEPPTPPTRTSEALRADLRSLNSQLAKMKTQWDEEKRKLLGEKAVLQDAANRLNVKVNKAEQEVRMVEENKKAGDKLRVGVESELEDARRVISELESDLKSERSRLRALSTEQDRVRRDKENILLQLQRTETDMEDVKNQLQRFKAENHELENELRVNANAEQKARLLEERVQENVETVEQLRQERSLLAQDHKDLQRRFSEISEHANRLRAEYHASQVSHDNRRHELDLQLGEIDDLRRALDDQADRLHRTEAEKNRIAAEKSDVSRTVAALEADLRRVRRDAEAFGRDLKLLRSEKERLEAKQREEAQMVDRTRKQSQTQIRLLTEQLEAQRAKTSRAKEELQSHVCAMDDRQLSALKLQHNKECKGLMVQIRYLKAKFTRESTLRNDLCYQKEYLLVLLSKFEKSERNIITSIARIGFPTPAATTPAKKPKKLKAWALTVMFLSRVRRASDAWREQSASKQAVVAALEEVRRRRAAV
ncbi:PACT-coil-coil domain-containing protein [Mycena sanguinolenta]|uniref:PACT-coil-coil domain-containing protein n=1 Tax=Mycena sanguinolenta TaxID=230812 RepID=A0A8H7DGG1_9AGAR|nr:PACT-coil-coil domain-containing protein [Mycena sanguinolenta]